MGGEGPGSSRASTVQSTQTEAINAARHIVSNQGGVEVTIHGTDGRFRDRDTVAPGNDPSPPKARR